MALASAGIVLWRQGDDGLEILLVHPGGPFWANKDSHAWSIPKGEYNPETEDPQVAAIREFGEELGHQVPDGPRRELAAFKAGRKTIRAWLVAGDLDPDAISSNNFEMEWPPKSGKTQFFPEVDQASWFNLDQAKLKLHKGQIPICDLVEQALK